MLLAVELTYVNVLQLAVRTYMKGRKQREKNYSSERLLPFVAK